MLADARLEWMEITALCCALGQPHADQPKEDMMWWTLLVMYVIGVIWRALYLALSDRARRRIKECALNLRYWLLLLLEPVRFVDLIHLKFIWLRPWSLRHALYMMTHSWGCSPGSEFSGGWFDMGLMSFHYRRPK